MHESLVCNLPSNSSKNLQGGNVNTEYAQLQIYCGELKRVNAELVKAANLSIKASNTFDQRERYFAQVALVTALKHAEELNKQEVK